MNFRGYSSVLHVLLLVMSVFAFAFLLASAIPLSSALTRQLTTGEPIEVEEQSDGSFVDRSGRVYYEDSNGQLQQGSLQRVATSDSATSTLVPTNNPTGPFSTDALAGIGAASALASTATGGSGSAADLSGLLGGLSSIGGLLKGSLGEALIWGGVVFGAATAVASVLGGDANLVKAAGIAGAVGAFSAKLIQGMFKTGPVTTIAIGAGIGFAVFYLLYEDVKYEAVSFSCMPWQAPIGVSKDVCETCNDATRPCSEYRCKSLGQTCELVNKGTVEERCVNVNPKDVTPPIITPDPRELTAGYTYQNVKLSPPGPGFTIARNGQNPCVEAFTPLRFGITTDEPAQCRIDFNSTTDFESMYAFMGGSNLFKYEHYEQFVLPHADDFGNTSFQLTNGKDLTFFIRCMDRNGNYNEAEYALNFCVDPSPDTTAPRIHLTSIDDESCIPATTDSGEVEFYVNEPSQCRWSREDQSYDLMTNDMACDTQLFQMNALQLYTCRANFTGVTKELTDFYVRCQDGQQKDVNDRNTNQESYEFSLRGSNQLKLRSIGPNGTIYGGVNPMPVELEVETLFGCEQSKANCYFSDREDGDYILFAETNGEDGIHKQTLYLTEGSYEYHVRCVDSGGNLIAESTEFDLDIDTASPIIARMYNDAGQLKIVTLRDSECSYSTENCDFLFEDGIGMPKDDTKVHFTAWNNEETYYIKCRDKFRDLTADCSAIVKPTKLFFDEDDV